MGCFIGKQLCGPSRNVFKLERPAQQGTACLKCSRTYFILLDVDYSAKVVLSVMTTEQAESNLNYLGGGWLMQ